MSSDTQPPANLVSARRRDLILSQLPKDVATKLTEKLDESNGDFDAAAAQLGDHDVARHTRLLHDLAELADDDENIVSALAGR